MAEEGRVFMVQKVVGGRGGESGAGGGGGGSAEGKYWTASNPC